MSQAQEAEALIAAIEGTAALSLVEHCEAVQGSETVEAVFNSLRDHEHEFVGVLEGEQFLGVVSRGQLGFTLGARYGFALRARKKITDFLLPHHLSVCLDTPLARLLQLALARRGESFHHDVALVNGENKLVGFISTQALVARQCELMEAKTRFADLQQALLQETNHELRLARETLEQRVEMRTVELAAANDHFRLARDEAERANRAKSDFLSRMSHELRTPLNAILGFGQLLEGDLTGPDELESVRHILHGGRHLLELIDEVLDISRIETGKLTLSMEPVHVGDVLQEAIALTRPLAARSNVRLHDMHCDRFAFADRQRLKQILLNLLSNAIKYNCVGGGVNFKYVEVAPGRLRFCVSDTGPGIRNEDLVKLFAPFERLQAGQTAVEGIGLGLSICKRLVGLMGGEMGVESALGVGSTFWFELAAAEEPRATFERTGGLLEEDSLERAPLTLLYIEDNLTNLQLVECVLKRRPGIQLLAAMQGSRGLELAAEHRPDLILLDLHLPDLRGDRVLERLLADPRTAGIPVVMISADATPGQVERLKGAGATDYLTKPINVRAFLQVVDAVEPRPANAQGRA